MFGFGKKVEKKEVIEIKSVVIDRRRYSQVYFKDSRGRITMGVLKIGLQAPVVGSIVNPFDICMPLGKRKEDKYE